MAEVERIGAKRVFLVVSGTMNRTTDEVAKVQAVLGSRHAGTYDSIPPFTPRSAVLQAAQQARDVGTDLVVSFGGGSVTEGGKMVRLCLQHNITDVDGFDRFRLMTSPVGKTVKPKYEGASIGQIAIPTTLSAGESSFKTARNSSVVRSSKAAGCMAQAGAIQKVWSAPARWPSAASRSPGPPAPMCAKLRRSSPPIFVPPLPFWSPPVISSETRRPRESPSPWAYRSTSPTGHR